MPLMLCSEPFTAEQLQPFKGAEVCATRDPDEFMRVLPEDDLVIGRMQVRHFGVARPLTFTACGD